MGQINGLALAYVITAVAMLAGLLLLRADSRAYWRLPVYALMFMVVGVVLWNLARKHFISPAAAMAHVQLVYYGALALYALVGFAGGCLLGRLTRGWRAPLKRQ